MVIFSFDSLDEILQNKINRHSLRNIKFDNHNSSVILNFEYGYQIYLKYNKLEKINFPEDRRIIDNSLKSTSDYSNNYLIEIQYNRLFLKSHLRDREGNYTYENIVLEEWPFIGSDYTITFLPINNFLIINCNSINKDVFGQNLIIWNLNDGELIFKEFYPENKLEIKFSEDEKYLFVKRNSDYDNCIGFSIIKLEGFKRILNDIFKSNDENIKLKREIIFEIDSLFYKNFLIIISIGYAKEKTNIFNQIKIIDLDNNFSEIISSYKEYEDNYHGYGVTQIELYKHYLIFEDNGKLFSINLPVSINEKDLIYSKIELQNYPNDNIYNFKIDDDEIIFFDEFEEKLYRTKIKISD